MYFINYLTKNNESVCKTTENEETAMAIVDSEAKVCSSELDVMSLKYNYVEYMFIIDKKAPEYDINAKIDSVTGKIYYELRMDNEEADIMCITDADRLSAHPELFAD